MECLFDRNTNIAETDALDLRDLSWIKVVGSVASDGVYLKSQINVKDNVFYLKLSNYDSYRGIFGHESVNELIACRLGNLLGFNATEGYLRKSLVVVDNVQYEAYVFAAKSYKTTESRCSFEDFYRNCRQSAEESPLDLCRRYGWESDIYKMFIFDYLIINRDRHGANLEVLKNDSIKLSPLFDNGISFVCSCTDTDDVTVFDVMQNRPVNNFIGHRSLEQNLSLIDKKLEINELRPEHRELLFYSLTNVLPSVYFDKIWEILCRRWEIVKEFCLT